MAYIETVEPATGRRESLWVMLSIALILFLGAIGLQLNHTDAAHHNAVTSRGPELTPPQRQLVMELSIAQPEIQFELDDNGALPTLELLNALEIAPFYTEQAGPWQWQLIDQRCYLATPDRPEAGFFLYQPHTDEVFLSAHAPHTVDSCEADHEWTRVKHSARNTP